MSTKKISTAFPIQHVTVAFDHRAESNVTESDDHKVLQILNSKGSIGPLLDYEFVMHDESSQTPNLVVNWMSDDTMAAEHGLEFRGYSAASLVDRFPANVYLNEQNWTSLRKPHHEHWHREFGTRAMQMYRKYMVAHEVGHVLGLEHTVSTSDECDLMEQQTFAPKRRCRPSPRIQNHTAKTMRIKRVTHPLV